jgi:hypothetical protein
VSGTFYGKICEISAIRGYSLPSSKLKVERSMLDVNPSFEKKFEKKGHSELTVCGKREKSEVRISVICVISD